MEKAHKDAIAGIKKSIKIIEDQIHKIIAANQDVSNNYRLLITVPAIGHFTAVIHDDAALIIVSRVK